MATINGIGTRFNGISKPNEQGVITATCWFTFIYLPIIPLWRAELIREITNPNEFRYWVINKQPIQIKEVLQTYMFGWIITPLLWFGPLILCIKEIAMYMGLLSSEPVNVFSHFEWYEGMIVFSILYMLVFTWKWKDWDEKRGLPKNYKEILRERQSVMRKPI